MKNEKILRPIEEKLVQWIGYKSNSPKVPYKGNEKLHDEYRMKNDLDSQLTKELKADTIVSLWIPLRLTLVRLHGYDDLKVLGNIKRDILFLTNLKKDLAKYLPIDNPIVHELSKLFEIGMTRANVMILPDGKINSERGNKPYYDYMPHFLDQCFKGGYFSKYFSDDKEFIKWIDDENLAMFFEGDKVSKDRVKDLAGTRSLTNGIPLYNKDIPITQMNLEGQKTMRAMVNKYIDILEVRNEFYQGN